MPVIGKTVKLEIIPDHMLYGSHIAAMKAKTFCFLGMQMHAAQSQKEHA
jgi:hypothetical protein